MPKVSPALVFAYSFASLHALYVTKVERKGRDRAELDAQIAAGAGLETFFAEAPALNPARALIIGVICGVRVEDIADKLMREIRYMDKLVDELAKGKAMGKILRG